MFQLLIGTLFCIFSAQAKSASDGEYFNTDANTKLWVEYEAPKNNGPLIVLLNGLTYSTKDWKEYKAELKSQMPDAGFLLYDMRMQGKSVIPFADSSDVVNEFFNTANLFQNLTKVTTWEEWRKYWTSGNYFLDWMQWRMQIQKLWLMTFDSFYTTNLKQNANYEVQVEDLAKILEHYKGTSDVHLIGLSYGGAIGEAFTAKYGDQVKTLTMIAPFVRRLPQQDNWIKEQIRNFRLTNPFLMVSDDILYKYFLKVLVYSTYPLAEPTLLENPYKTEAAYQLAVGTLDFDAVEIAKNGTHLDKTTLVISGQDEYVPKDQHEELWQALKAQGARARVIIENADHKVNLKFPKSLAELTKKIVFEDSSLTNGVTVDISGSRQKNINICQGVFL